jgi:hypothetical protein
MTKFNDTDAGQDFIDSADARNTSPEVMKAIAFFARDAAEAERLWMGDGLADGTRLPIPAGTITTAAQLIEAATGNGRIDPATLFWGDKPLDRAVRDLLA